MLVIAALLAAGCFDGSSAHPTPRASCRPARSYAPRVTPSKGGSGTAATLAGRLPQLGENGKPAAPTIKLAVWWNLSFRRYFTAAGGNPSPDRPGPVLNVATVRVRVPNPCTYRIAFHVPSVRPGSYRIVLLDFGGGGFAGFAPVAFRVR